MLRYVEFDPEVLMRDFKDLGFTDFLYTFETSRSARQRISTPPSASDSSAVEGGIRRLRDALPPAKVVL